MKNYDDFSAIAAREMHKHGIKLHSFSIGVDETSPDVVAARKVAKHIDTIHHEVHFTVEVRRFPHRFHIYVPKLRRYPFLGLKVKIPLTNCNHAIQKLIETV